MSSSLILRTIFVFAIIFVALGVIPKPFFCHTHAISVAFLRLLNEGDLLRCFRDSGSVTYASTLPAPLVGPRCPACTLPSPSASCISSFVQSLSTFDSNVREWHFVQHSLFRGKRGKDLLVSKINTTFAFRNRGVEQW